jgi:hypothetical protein
MLRAAVLIGLFLVLLWGSAMSVEFQTLMMFAGISAVCLTVDRWSRGEG